MQTTVAHRLDPLPPSIDRSTRSRVHQARKNTWLRLIRRREKTSLDLLFPSALSKGYIPVVPRFPSSLTLETHEYRFSARTDEHSSNHPPRIFPSVRRQLLLEQDARANSPKFDPRSSFAIEIANEGWFRRESQSKEKGEREGSEPRSFESISPTSYSDGSR